MRVRFSQGNATALVYTMPVPRPTRFVDGTIEIIVATRDEMAVLHLNQNEADELARYLKRPGS